MVYYPPLEEQFLWIHGKISQSSLALVKAGLPADKPENAEILFVGYSFDDIPLGKSFGAIFPRENPNQGIYYESKVFAVTQQMGIATEVIPRGWKTICIFEFPSGIPDIIKNLPVINSWFESKLEICISNKEVWEAIKKLS